MSNNITIDPQLVDPQLESQAFPDTELGTGDHPQLLPPPSRYSDSIKEAIDQANIHAREQGYALVQGPGSKKDTNGILKRVIVICDKGGKDRASDSIGKRNSSSRKTGCQFKAVIERANNSMVTDGWRFRVRESGHNHPASISASAHPALRKRSGEVTARIRAMTVSSIAPKQIQSAIMQDGSGVTLVRQDLYNERKLLRRDLLHGLSPTQALILALNEYGGNDTSQQYIVFHHQDQFGQLDYLFWAHPDSVKLFNSTRIIYLLTRLTRLIGLICHCFISLVALI